MFGTVKGDGNVVTQTRTVGNFTTVKVNNLGTLTITIGSPESLEVEAEENLQEYLETNVSNGLLTIGVKFGTSIDNTKPINYYATMPSVEALTVTGSANIKAPTIDASNFVATASGSGNLHIDALNGTNLTVRASNSSDTKVAGGSVTNQDTKVSGSADYNAVDMETQTANVTVKSSGSGTVWVDEQLTAHVSGSGDLRYKGDATVDKHVSGSGSIRKIHS